MNTIESVTGGKIRDKNDTSDGIAVICCAAPSLNCCYQHHGLRRFSIPAYAESHEAGQRDIGNGKSFIFEVSCRAESTHMPNDYE